MEYIYSILILIGLNMIMAASFNLIIGFGGLAVAWLDAT